jgi:hypothetical protein
VFIGNRSLQDREYITIKLKKTNLNNMISFDDENDDGDDEGRGEYERN